MKASKFRNFFLGLALFAVLVIALSMLQNRMNGIRVEKELTDTEPLRNAPPLVAFTTVALGGFRGLVADWLWLRSGKMQDEGNYFELVQLANWITKLQPRFTAAHSFLAWNMAYNVSVTFHGVDDRWRWVQRGIELIRDEALLYNPSDPELFQQLGWIYQHKMGKDLDDANRYYKTMMGWEMIKLFGPYEGRWDILGSGALTRMKLQDRIGRDSALWTMLAEKQMTFDQLEQQFRQEGRVPQDFVEKLTREGYIEQVDLCLRNRWLQNKYRLNPRLMMAINAAYGELDWRLPEAHAIYWATRGKQEWRKTDSNFKELQCDRMIFQSLSAAFQGGRLMVVNQNDTYQLEMMPNLNVVDTTRAFYESAKDKHGEKMVRGAFENFMVDAVVMLYKFGARSKANGYFQDSKKKFGGRFDGQLDRFVLKELEEDVATANYNQGQSTVQSYIVMSCRMLAVGKMEDAVGYERMAKAIHTKYNKDIGKTTHERRALPSYSQMKRTMVKWCMENFEPPVAEALRQALAQLKAEAEAEE